MGDSQKLNTANCKFDQKLDALYELLCEVRDNQNKIYAALSKINCKSEECSLFVPENNDLEYIEERPRNQELNQSSSHLSAEISKNLKTHTRKIIQRTLWKKIHQKNLNTPKKTIKNKKTKTKKKKNKTPINYNDEIFVTKESIYTVIRTSKQQQKCVYRPWARRKKKKTLPNVPAVSDTDLAFLASNKALSMNILVKYYI